ncbi:MAG: tetratricopeptide repeat protein [Anaerolineales bacterium]|uniref:Tetratricopeptide repeat protein n=1 Tax=Candidatus Desulfolinea nitratireducens TaxID=2841698 RepID=A0A8J6TIY3_9CHLR|nr:tetratricopeptide repeat protein [Candidatus Desulfolinea nitratireducens]MBL6961806.1 tetratricopeptide repeat protein [Anaerolineales bacterium]
MKYFQKPLYKNLSILLFLFVLMVLPRTTIGVYNEKKAQQAVTNGDYLRASTEYELAAHRLFWRGDLWDKTGLSKLIAGQKIEAIEAYQEARKRNSLSAYGWDILGQDLWDKDDYKGAILTWKEGLARYPAYIEFHARLAMAYREINDFSAEQEEIKKWLVYEREGLESAPYHYRLGLLLILDSPEEALDELILAAHLDDEFAPVVETLRTALNLALLEKDPAEELILVGRGLGLVGEWQFSADAFHNASQAHPENAFAWAWLGEARQHLEEDGLPDLEKALSLHPNSPMIHSFSGLYWQRQDNEEKALREFKIAVGLEPENPNWQSAVGDAYARSGDIPPALVAFQHATVLAPGDPKYWHLLALFSVQYAVQMEEIGLPAARRAVILSPENATFADTLGWVYFNLEQDSDAEKQFNYALDLDQNLDSAHLHLGIFYLKHSHRDLARQSLLRARTLSPDSLAGMQAAQLLEQYFQE